MIISHFNFNCSMDKRNSRRSKVEIVDNAVGNIFKKYDENQDDYMNLNEFTKMIDDLNLHPKLRMDPKELKRIFEMMDIDRDGKVSKEELINALLVISSRSH